MLYVVDTHSLVWFIAGDSRLSPLARDILADPGPGNGLVIPTIVLAESWDLARKKRTGVPFTELMRRISGGMALVWPLEASTINRFPGQLPDIHDEIVVATALEVQGALGLASIITRDNMIHSLGLVPCIW